MSLSVIDGMIRQIDGNIQSINRIMRPIDHKSINYSIINGSWLMAHVARLMAHGPGSPARPRPPGPRAGQATLGHEP